MREYWETEKVTYLYERENDEKWINKDASEQRKKKKDNDWRERNESKNTYRIKYGS